HVRVEHGRVEGVELRRRQRRRVAPGDHLVDDPTVPWTTRLEHLELLFLDQLDVVGGEGRAHDVERSRIDRVPLTIRAPAHRFFEAGRIVDLEPDGRLHAFGVRAYPGAGRRHELLFTLPDVALLRLSFLLDAAKGPV